jgi:hypothetical protein
MIWKMVLKWVARLVAAGVLAGLILFASGLYWIYATVRDTSSKARQAYGGSAVEALGKTVESETSSFKEKNDAVWALGQIADSSALPMLKKFYTGVMPEREPLDKVLSQYELKKAIKWCEQGNMTSWMYKGITRDSSR